MKKLIISAIVLGLAGIGCTTKKQSPEVNQLKIKTMKEQDKEQITNLLQVYEKSLNTADVALAVSCYSKEGVFMPAGAPTAKGAEVKGAYEFVFSQIQLNIRFSIEEIVIDNDLAFAITTSQGTTLIHATGDTVPEENRELFVFAREAGQWKIARYMFNKMQ